MYMRNKSLESLQLFGLKSIFLAQHIHKKQKKKKKKERPVSA